MTELRCNINAVAYTDAVCTYLSIAIGRVSDRWQCQFHIGGENSRRENPEGVFARQAYPYDVGTLLKEIHFLCQRKIGWLRVEWVAKAVENLPISSEHWSEVHQANATTTLHSNDGPVIITDPPYYDNIRLR